MMVQQPFDSAQWDRVYVNRIFELEQSMHKRDYVIATQIDPPNFLTDYFIIQHWYDVCGVVSTRND